MIKDLKRFLGISPTWWDIALFGTLFIWVFGFLGGMMVLGLYLFLSFGVHTTWYQKKCFGSSDKFAVWMTMAIFASTPLPILIFLSICQHTSFTTKMIEIFISLNIFARLVESLMRNETGYAPDKHPDITRKFFMSSHRMLSVLLYVFIAIVTLDIQDNSLSIYAPTLSGLLLGMSLYRLERSIKDLPNGLRTRFRDIKV